MRRKESIKATKILRGCPGRKEERDNKRVD